MIPRRIVGMGFGLLFLGVTLTGCSNFPPVWWPRLPSDGIKAETVLDYYRKAESLRFARVGKEIARLRDAYRRKPDDETLFQLVALAAQPGRPQNDRQLALDLLKEFRRRDTGERSLRTLAALLEDQLKEQRRLAGARDEALRRAQTLEATSRELQDKLRALEDIEKILRQRER